MRLILFIFLMWSAVATAETRRALLISNEKYPEKAAGSNLFGPLGKAHRDREQMAEALKQYRFEMTEVLDADKDKMDAALVAFTEKLEKSGVDSVGVIYFVGHGAEVGGKLHLIPTQEKLADDKAIKNRTVSADELIDRLTTGIENGKNQGVRLLILDACRSRIKTRGVNERKVDLNAHGALVGYAAASGKEAVDSDDSYTMHLTKQMKLNGHLKIEEVFKKARIELAKASGNNQISLEYGGLLGDFCLDNCQSNPLEKDLKAKEQELADLKQKLAQNITNPNEINELKKRLEAIEKQSGMSGMTSNDGMKGMSSEPQPKKTQIKSIDYDNWRELKTFTGHSFYVSSVVFSPDGKTALSGSEDKTLKLWDLETGNALKTFTGHSGYVNSVAFSPNGRRALSSGGHSLKLWDIATGKELKTISGHSALVNSVAFSPDGKTALSGSEDTTLKLWDLETSNALKTFTGHSDYVFSVAFSPDGKTALSGSRDKTLKLWDLETGKELKTFTGHSSSGVKSVVFSPDGQRALSGSYDTTLKLWDIASGKELKTFTGHSGWVYSVTFSSDGQRVLSGSCDKPAGIGGCQEGGFKLWGAP